MYCNVMFFLRRKVPQYIKCNKSNAIEFCTLQLWAPQIWKKIFCWSKPWHLQNIVDGQPFDWAIKLSIVCSKISDNKIQVGKCVWFQIIGCVGRVKKIAANGDVLVNYPYISSAVKLKRAALTPVVIHLLSICFYLFWCKIAFTYLNLTAVCQFSNTLEVC